MIDVIEQTHNRGTSAQFGPIHFSFALSCGAFSLLTVSSERPRLCCVRYYIVVSVEVTDTLLVAVIKR